MVAHFVWTLDLLLPLFLLLLSPMPQTRPNRLEFKQMFEDAYERHRTASTEGVSFILRVFPDCPWKLQFWFWTSNQGLIFIWTLDVVCELCWIIDFACSVIAKGKWDMLFQVKGTSFLYRCHRGNLLTILQKVHSNMGNIQTALCILTRCLWLTGLHVVVGENKGGVVASVEGLRGFVCGPWTAYEHCVSDISTVVQPGGHSEGDSRLAHCIGQMIYMSWYWATTTKEAE